MADPRETTQSSAPPDGVEPAELLDAVRGLAAQVGSLQGEIQALRASVGALPAGDADEHGWDDGRPVRHDSPRWVRTLDSPQARHPVVPRLFLEIVFLVAVSVLTAVAGLEPALIVLVMAGAWALVATAEWAASREARKREEALYRSPFGTGILGEDPSWFGPPTDGDAAVSPALEPKRSEDAIAKLPPPADE